MNVTVNYDFMPPKPRPSWTDEFGGYHFYAEDGAEWIVHWGPKVELPARIRQRLGAR